MAAAGNGRQGPSLPAIGEGPTAAPEAAPGGFPCPACGSRTIVTDSRPRTLLAGWRRRRECVSCATRFTTIEVIVTDDVEASVAFKRRATPLIKALARLAEGLDLD